MENTNSHFFIDDTEYTVHRLTLDDLPAIQEVCAKCLDFMLLVDGHAADPESVKDDFLDVPPGRSSADKFVFGICNRHNELVGLLDVLRDYPDQSTWWIGLLLFIPEARSKGLGKKVLQGFVEFISLNGGQAIMLGVVEANTRAIKFWTRKGFELVEIRAPEQFGEKIHRVMVMRRRLVEV